MSVNPAPSGMTVIREPTFRLRRSLVVDQPCDRPSVLSADALPEGDIRQSLPGGDKVVEYWEKLLEPPVQVVGRQSRGFCADLRRHYDGLRSFRKFEDAWRAIESS